MGQAALSMAKVDDMAIGLERSMQNNTIVLEKLAAVKVLLLTAASERRRGNIVVTGESTGAGAEKDSPTRGWKGSGSTCNRSFGTSTPRRKGLGRFSRPRTC